MAARDNMSLQQQTFEGHFTDSVQQHKTDLFFFTGLNRGVTEALQF